MASKERDLKGNIEAATQAFFGAKKAALRALKKNFRSHSSEHEDWLLEVYETFVDLFAPGSDANALLSKIVANHARSKVKTSRRRQDSDVLHAQAQTDRTENPEGVELPVGIPRRPRTRPKSEQQVLPPLPADEWNAKDAGLIFAMVRELTPQGICLATGPRFPPSLITAALAYVEALNRFWTGKLTIEEEAERVRYVYGMLAYHLDRAHRDRVHVAALRSVFRSIAAPWLDDSALNELMALVVKKTEAGRGGGVAKRGAARFCLELLNGWRRKHGLRPFRSVVNAGFVGRTRADGDHELGQCRAPKVHETSRRRAGPTGIVGKPGGS